MQPNVGGTDRTVRLGLGLVLLALGVAGYTGLAWVAVGPLPQFLTSVLLALVGLILVVTGLTRRCIVNRLLGIDTARR